ncbi:MAG: penicillin-binding protein 2 [Gammaproteobacteria bacterium]|nr:penicillin-binding protein 2 [Gammaproteobacteria bacterium]MBK81895.1 penicillin-binding protein 2 [Gammaproteobacteria bacterium]
MSPRIAIKDDARERRVFAARAATAFLVVLMLVGGLVLRLIQLQVWEHETYQTRSEQNRIQVQPLAPPRGLIYDRNGELLASNRPISTLTVVQERVRDLPGLIDELAGLVEITPEDVERFNERRERRRRPFEPVALKLNLSEEEVARLAVNRHRLPGVEIATELVRHYPLDALMAHAVGSVRRVTEDDLRRLDGVRYSATRFIGRHGVERYYEQSLHGDVGYQKVETDAHGRIRQVLDINPPVAGQNITVHLDSRLQIAAAAALGDRRGAVVALDPRSGGILAMVSQPAYDPNLFVTGISDEQYRSLVSSRDTPLFNRAINGQYAPGSTFKPIVGLAGLSLGVVGWDEEIVDQGWFRLPGQDRIYRDWSWTPDNSGGQGRVDLHRAIYRSSNVFFYDMATRMDIDDLSGFAAQFGLGQRLAVDVPETSPGLLPDRDWKRSARNLPWYPGDSVNIGIGQGDLLVTPLQLATVAATIANRGRIVRPRMLLASDRPLAEFDPPPPLPPVQGPSPDDWERMVDAMEAVVHRGNQGYGQNGTAWYYIGQEIPYRMAGKSGTAQVVEIQQGEQYDEEELGEYERKHAWFIAFAPADDPVIALAVLVENGGGGSAVAAPVAREVLDAYLLPQLAAR